MWIERALAPLFPQWAFNRAKARLAFDALRGYDAARMSRRTRSWKAGNGSGNTETYGDLPTLRNRARKLVRDNPYAFAALEVLTAYQVGYGIIPRSSTGNRGLDKQADDLFAEWARTADMAGRLDFYGLQAQASRTRSEAGEAVATLVPLTAAEMRRHNAPVPLALQLLEPDYLDELKDERLTDGIIVQGVEVNSYGRPRAYWLYPEHPGDRFGRLLMPIRNASVRTDAARVLHLHKAYMSRPGQVRGVPDLAPVLTRLAALDEFEDALIEQAKVAACLAAFVTSPAPQGRGPLEGPVEAQSGQQRKTLAPGLIERLLPGEDAKFNSPPSAAGVDVLPKHTLRAIASGLGLTYDLLTGDLTDANYSSLRAGRLAFKRRLEQAQWLMLIPQFCQPVWDAFIRSAQQTGALPDRAGRWPVEWSPPRFEQVDPQKDSEAIIAQLRAGLMTWGQAVSEMGYDPRKQAAEIEQWNAVFDAGGLILDGDPRRMNKAGGAHDPRQTAAIEIAATGAAMPAAPAAEQTAPNQ